MVYRETVEEQAETTHLFGEERGECFELSNVAFVEGEEQFLEPFMLRPI